MFFVLFYYFFDNSACENTHMQYHEDILYFIKPFERSERKNWVAELWRKMILILLLFYIFFCEIILYYDIFLLIL